MTVAATTAAVAADAATAAADTTTEVVETIIDNSGKTIAFAALLLGGALAVGWLVRQYGERAMDAAAGAGLLDPPTLPEPPAPADIDGTDIHEDDDDQDDDQPETGDGSWAQ